MRFYKDVRKALAEHPTSWTLMEGVRDDDPLPEFPSTALNVPKETGEPTSLESLRESLLQHPPADPHSLGAAVKLGILGREEAESVLQKFWGDAFNLDDLMAHERKR